MSNFNFLDLTARSLHMFVVVFEEGSVTRAANRLDVGQSAVSHMLEKLRKITGDPLFVRAGRGIVATERAKSLVEQVRPILGSMQGLTEPPEFDPSKTEGVLTIGAAAMQREVFIPPLLQVLRKKSPNLDLKIINSGVASQNILRTGQCDLVITPAPPDGVEFMQKKLFVDKLVCFRDPSTPVPTSINQYVGRPHAKVVFSTDERSVIDGILQKMGKVRRIALRVESFSALPNLMRQTDLIIALPQIIKDSFMDGFAISDLPFEIAPMDFYMGWHLSKNVTPYHRWIRSEITAIANKLKN